MLCCGRGSRDDVAIEAHVKPGSDASSHHQEPGWAAVQRGEQERGKKEAEAHNLRELAQTTFAVGVALAEEGKLPESLACFRDCVEIDCKHVGAHYMLAITYAELNHPTEALNYYRKTIRLQPTHFLAWYNLGYIYTDQHQGERAIKCYRRASELEPQDLDALVNLGLALKSTGQMAEACKTFQRAIDIDESCIMALFNLANTLMDMRSLDRAIATYLQLLQIDPEHHDSQFNLGICYTSRSCSPLSREADIKQAISWYDLVGTQEGAAAAAQLRSVLLSETEKVSNNAVSKNGVISRKPLGTLSGNLMFTPPDCSQQSQSCVRPGPFKPKCSNEM